MWGLDNIIFHIAHGKPIADFTFSPLERSILATSSRADGLIRIWKIPSDVQSLPNTQNPQRELDVASIYLAGHEKKIELLSFHPTVGNILMSSSADSTIRLWEIESMQDQIVMSSLEDTTIQSTSFDYYGNVFAATTSNSHLCIYDARSQTTPVASVNTEFNQSKGCKVSWLSPDPLIAVSGFKDKGVREFLIYDIRYPEKGAVQTLTVQGTGIGLLNPIWDPALPLMYLTSRGEGVRLYELHYGSLDYVTMLKVEKQATSMDLMPKTVCNSVKCEIARFLRIG